MITSQSKKGKREGKGGKGKGKEGKRERKRRKKGKERERKRGKRKKIGKKKEKDGFWLTQENKQNLFGENFPLKEYHIFSPREKNIIFPLSSRGILRYVRGDFGKKMIGKGGGEWFSKLIYTPGVKPPELKKQKKSLIYHYIIKFRSYDLYLKKFGLSVFVLRDSSMYLLDKILY